MTINHLDLLDNPNCMETSASFRIIGDTLIPDEATGIVQLQPTVARRKGELYAGARKTTVSRTGIWILDSHGKLNSRNLERHLWYLLDRLGQPSQVFLDFVRRNRYRVDFYCYWRSMTGIHGGPELSSTVLYRMAEFTATLGIEFAVADSDLEEAQKGDPHEKLSRQGFVSL